MGKSCYPLSPSNSKNNQVEEGDQLLVILKNLGHCDESDRSFLDSEQTLWYFEILNEAVPAKDEAELSKFLSLKSPTIS